MRGAGLRGEPCTSNPWMGKLGREELLIKYDEKQPLCLFYLKLTTLHQRKWMDRDKSKYRSI
jgi:hypothetical protein